MKGKPLKVIHFNDAAKFWDMQCGARQGNGKFSANGDTLKKEGQR